jgi:hypothetical protein
MLDYLDGPSYIVSPAPPATRQAQRGIFKLLGSETNGPGKCVYRNVTNEPFTPTTSELIGAPRGSTALCGMPTR